MTDQAEVIRQALQGAYRDGRRDALAEVADDLVAAREALLYAEKLLRSSVASERMIGADLKQILT